MRARRDQMIASCALARSEVVEEVERKNAAYGVQENRRRLA